MPAMTLPEYAKMVQGQNPFAAGVINTFAEANIFLRHLPFKDAPTGVYSYGVREALPDNMAFRGLNEVPTTGYGVINDFIERTYPLAGNIDVDRRKLARHGPERLQMEREAEIEKKGIAFTNTVIDGDNQSQPREFTGLRARLKAVGTGASSVDGTNWQSRILANSTVSGGAAPSLSKLNKAISLVSKPTHILMSLDLKTALIDAIENKDIRGSSLTKTKDGFGTEIAYYGALPIITGFDLSPMGEFLPYNEVAWAGGSASTTSIYVLSLRDGGVCGIQQSPIEVTDMGMMENGVHMRVNVEHDIGLVVEHPYSAIRMNSIAQAAWTN